MAKILIIDRDVMEAGLEEAALELKGHDVRVEAEGEDALRLVGERWPDLVILDPNHDVGVPAVHAARSASDEAAAIPLLLVSNPYEGPSTGSDELADAQLAHPFDGATLNEAIDRLLGR